MRACMLKETLDAPMSRLLLIAIKEHFMLGNLQREEVHLAYHYGGWEDPGHGGKGLW